MIKEIVGVTLAAGLGLGGFAGGMVLSNNLKDDNYAIVLAEKEEDMNSLASSLSSLNDDISNKDKVIAGLQNSKDLLQSQYDALVKENFGNKEELNRLNGQITQLNGQINSYKEQVKNLQSQYEIAQEQYNSVNAQYQELLKQSSVDKQQIQSLNENILQLNSRILSLQEQLKNLKEEGNEKYNQGFQDGVLSVPSDELKNEFMDILLHPAFGEAGNYLSGDIFVGSGISSKTGEDFTFAYNLNTGVLKKLYEGYLGSFVEFNGCLYIIADYTENDGDYSVLKGQKLLKLDFENFNFDIVKDKISLEFSHSVLGLNEDEGTCLIAYGNSGSYSGNIYKIKQDDTVEQVYFDCGDFNGSWEVRYDISHEFMFLNGKAYRYYNGNFEKCFDCVYPVNVSSFDPIFVVNPGYDEYDIINITNYKTIHFSNNITVYGYANNSNSILLRDGIDNHLYIIDSETMTKGDDLGEYVSDISCNHEDIIHQLFAVKKDGILSIVLLNNDNLTILKTFEVGVEFSRFETDYSRFMSVYVNEEFSEKQFNYSFDTEELSEVL